MNTFTDLTELTAWLRDLAARRAAPPLSEVQSLLEGDDVTQLRIEAHRNKGGTTVVAKAMRTGALPAAPPLDGWQVLKAGIDGWSATAAEGRLDLDVRPEDGLVAVSWRSFAFTPLSREQTLSELERVPGIGAFAELAHVGEGDVRSYGLGRDSDLGMIGLVTVDVEVERIVAVEAALRAAGLAETEEGRWEATEDDRSVIALGRTLYGYVGPVPLSIGGMAPSPRARSSQVMQSLVRVRDAAVVQLTPAAREQLEEALRYCYDDDDYDAWVGRALEAAPTDRVRSLCDEARALLASAPDHPA